MEHELITKIAEAERVAYELPQSREKSLVLTKLDEARLWARELINKAEGIGVKGQSVG